REDDDAGDDDQCRQHERPVRRRPQLLGRRLAQFGLCNANNPFAHAFSLRSRIGLNCSVAFFSSAAGSEPDSVAVNAVPMMSRTSVPGMTPGSPSFEIWADAATESTHAAGIDTPLRVSASLRMESRNGTPPPVCNSLAPISFDTAHWQ